jgi:hypothetical protein
MAITQPYGWTDPNTGEYIPSGSGHAQVVGAIPDWTGKNMPNVNVSVPGKTTVKYPGTEAGNLQYEYLKGDIAAAGETERRALANQQKQVDTANALKNDTVNSTGYTMWNNRLANLQPTYTPELKTAIKGQARDVFAGQEAQQRRDMVAGQNRGGAVPSGYQRMQLDANQRASAAGLNRALTEQDVTFAKQDYQDQIDALKLAAERATFDYGLNSAVAQMLWNTYNDTIAKTPEYDMNAIKGIGERMALPQEYTIDVEGGGSGGEVGGGEGGGEGGGGGGSGGGGSGGSSGGGNGSSSGFNNPTPYILGKQGLSNAITSSAQGTGVSAINKAVKNMNTQGMTSAQIKAAIMGK